MSPLLAAVRSQLPRLVRAGALLVLLGAAFAALSLPAALTPSSWAGAQHFVNYAAALGGWDLTSLILRYLVFATVLLVGLRVTRGLAAARAHQLIAGGIGRWALGLGCLAVTLAFILMRTDGSPAGLQPAGGAGDADMAPWFTAAGRA